MAHHYRHGHVLAGKLSIYMHHPLSLLHRLLGRGMGGVSLLPEELGGTQE